jgi:hypothetical protein
MPKFTINTIVSGPIAECVFCGEPRQAWTRITRKEDPDRNGSGYACAKCDKSMPYEQKRNVFTPQEPLSEKDLVTH